jgi:hypothetical protein
MESEPSFTPAGQFLFDRGVKARRAVAGKFPLENTWFAHSITGPGQRKMLK